MARSHLIPFAVTVLASALSMSAALAASKQYMIKVPISKLAELQGTVIEVSPSPAVFGGDVPIGASATAINVVVKNSGFSPISSIVPTLTGGASDFTLRSDCPSTLAGMSSCTLTLDFKPTAVGARTGSLAVSSSAKNGLQLVPITGSAIAPDASLTANPFLVTQVHGTSEGTLVLTNSSTVTLQLRPAPLTGDFILAGGSCGGTLAAGASCTYSVAFKPVATGAKAGTFGVTLSVGQHSFERTVDLQGTAQAPSGTVSAVDFGATPAGVTVLRDATVTNTGAGPLALGTPSVSGAGFSIASGGSCTGTLAKGASCTVKVQLLPAGTSAHAGTLSVPLQHAAALTAQLTGQSQQALLSAIAPATRAFGSVAVGASSTSLAHTLTNTGNIAATGLTYTAAGGFGINQGDCTGSLAAGASCKFTATFSPSQAQAYAGSASVSSSNAGTQHLALTGTGAQSKATLTSAPSLNLADWYQSGTITGAFAYRNDGNSEMTLASPGLVSPLSVAGNTSSGVAPGASCNITVALLRNASTGGSSAQSFTAAGAGVPPAKTSVNWSIYSVNPSWSPSTLDFGAVLLGVPTTKTATIHNSGSVAANWSGSFLNLPSDVVFDAAACGNVPAGGSCQVKATFTPSKARSYDANGIIPQLASVPQNTLSIKAAGAMVDYSGLLSSYVNPTYQMSGNPSPWLMSMGQYYWAQPSGHIKAEAGSLSLGKQVDFTGSAPIKAKLRFLVDDVIANLSVNGNAVDLQPNKGFFDVNESGVFTLLPGLNAIQLEVVNNFFGPAGFVIEVVDESGSVKLSDSSGWKYSGTKRLVPLWGSPMEWAGRVGASCKDYKNAPAGYTNASSSGLYLVDMGHGIETVYCDMVTDGGGWTLAARSKPGATGEFGWHAVRGSADNFGDAYSLGVLKKSSLQFSQVLIGEAASNGQGNGWGPYVYRLNVSRGVLVGAATSSVDIGMPTPLNPGGSTHFVMAGLAGYSSSAAGSYFFRDMPSDPNSYGLFPAGWRTAYGPEGAYGNYGGHINGKSGLLMVR